MLILSLLFRVVRLVLRLKLVTVVILLEDSAAAATSFFTFIWTYIGYNGSKIDGAW